MKNIFIFTVRTGLLNNSVWLDVFTDIDLLNKSRVFSRNNSRSIDFLSNNMFFEVPISAQYNGCSRMWSMEFKSNSKFR